VAMTIAARGQARGVELALAARTLYPTAFA
jgi:hypothetical protein